MIAKAASGISLIILISAACRKERICNCSVTKTGTSTTTAAITYSVPFVGEVPLVDTSFTAPVFEYESRDRKFEKATKKEAKANCLSYSEPYSENMRTVVPNFLLVTNSRGTITYDCSLK
jgi:hypothetical protein